MLTKTFSFFSLSLARLRTYSHSSLSIAPLTYSFRRAGRPGRPGRDDHQKRASDDAGKSKKARSHQVFYSRTIGCITILRWRRRDDGGSSTPAATYNHNTTRHLFLSPNRSPRALFRGSFGALSGIFRGSFGDLSGSFAPRRPAAMPGAMPGAMRGAMACLFLLRLDAVQSAGAR